jgi:hypothetical protein
MNEKLGPRWYDIGDGRWQHEETGRIVEGDDMGPFVPLDEHLTDEQVERLQRELADIRAGFEANDARIERVLRAELAARDRQIAQLRRACIRAVTVMRFVHLFDLPSVEVQHKMACHLPYIEKALGDTDGVVAGSGEGDT